MTTLGIYHWTGNNRSGAEASITSFRMHHPDAPYFLVCDGGPDHYDICKKLGVEYYHSQTNLGYPSPHWGHDRERVKIFLERIFMACVSLGTTHLIISEDDVICLNPVKYDPAWKVASYDIQGGNFINSDVLDVCEQMSGVKPDRECYGVGAGTIIDTKTYINTFPLMMEFMDRHFDRLHRNQPQLGWNDCFLQIYFFLAGVEYSVNPRLFNIFPEDPNTDLDALQKSYDMVHNYKNFYENRR
jgi:hypothetical protein